MTVEKKYLVGEVSKITGISRDTLRFYDKISLLKPKYVDPDNHYRYYTYDQFWSLDIITCCRSLNISIEMIKTILASKSNDKVLTLLHEYQREAQELSQYYKRISEDIDWYTEQNRRMEQAQTEPAVTIKQLPERAVLYGKNSEETHAYHLKLQELCRTAVGRTNSIRRNYGFILDESLIGQNQFIKKGEYIQFEEHEFMGIDSKYLTTIPAGSYACCVINVVNDQADFSPILSWLRERNLPADYVIADEIGLKLFEYLDCGYLCEVKVLLK